MILTRDNNAPLFATYEAIYADCRAAVCIHNSGEALYDNLRHQVERCMSDISIYLVQGKPGIPWVKTFVEICQWFETQVVSGATTYYLALTT
jgi:cullin 4